LVGVKFYPKPKPKNYYLNDTRVIVVDMSFHVVSVNEDKTRVKPSRLDRVFRISVKQLLILILIILVASASFVWASDRIETHKRWASMLEMSQRFSVHFTEVYLRLPSVYGNETDPTHYWFQNELDYAEWALNKLMKLDEAHTSELVRIEELIMNLRSPNAIGPWFNNSQFADLGNSIYSIAQKLPQAYWNPLNSTSVNSDTGPPFWYFGPSPPDEAILQQIATLAIHAKEIIVP
jgi:hypothetical protein